MKKLHVMVAGLGYDRLKRYKATKLAGLKFAPLPSVFPALTCPAQATLRTGLAPTEHGMVANGYWSQDLQKPLFWEQSANLVKGKRVWADLRARGGKVGLFFLQQSLGEEVEALVSPAPIHKHNGGMMLATYTKPTGAASILEDLYGKFPLHRYWGPLATPRVGRACINYFERTTDMIDVDEAYLYLPTLDYAAQRNGPDSAADVEAFRELKRQLERLADICQKRACELSVIGDYEITPVTAEPVMPNVILRRHDLFKVRVVKGRAYPDFYQSTAFAMCDHEVCLVYGPEREKAVELLLATGKYERPEHADVDPRACLLLAQPGSWCDYRWWSQRREAPDFARHVDIHNKPGYDPRELFFFNSGTVKGTHGRACTIAKSES